jgi:hypothetical protein
MPPDFLLGILQTAIGSSLGFVFGIGAFHYQQRRQLVDQEKRDRRAALDALNRLNTAAGANIEALANARIGLIDKLSADLNIMRSACDRYYKIPIRDRDEIFPSITELSQSLQNFYKSFLSVSIMKIPQNFEYSILSKDMPALPVFAHRAIGEMEELNDRIEARNSLIHSHAQEGGTNDGMTSLRFMYYVSMLTSLGEAIRAHSGFALDFWRLVHDQIKSYTSARGEDQNLREYRIAPEALKFMPEEELFPLMREQLVTFDA